MKNWLKSGVATVVLIGGSVGTAEGSTLYFAFNRNYDLKSPNSSLFLFGKAGQSVTVSNLAGFNQTVTLNPSGFFNLPIPDTFQQSGTGILNTGFKVVSPDPVAGYFVNRAPATTDMTYLLDSAALGKRYVVASMGGGADEGSQVAIHATQDNTSVTFTPKGSAPIAVVLQAGETYKYAGGTTDLTGSRVVADKPVAVFAGHACALVPPDRLYCDTLLEQMIPDDRLSKQYLLTASKPAGAPEIGFDLVRVVATENGTTVKVNGAAVATLNEGDFHEFNLTGGALVEADKPVLVAQYLVGQGSTDVNTDPAMAVVPGADTWLKEYRLSTPADDQAFTDNYASIVIDTDDLASLKLDGSVVDTSGFTAIGATGYSRGIVPLPVGLFTLTADSPFLVMLGGGADYDSYLTYGGATFAPGVSPPPLPPPPPPTGVAEPASLALFGLGLLGLAALRRRA
ncbi:MAG: IgGFc-binding protein [Elioraea sp.]|nr:IgGFc-binding protein [Elioraea sp.]